MGTRVYSPYPIIFYHIQFLCARVLVLDQIHLKLFIFISQNVVLIYFKIRVYV